MKKLFTSLKFLLVAVCLLGGGNSAWAETVGAIELTTNYLGAHSKIQTIENGSALHYVFNVTKATDANYKNWLLWVAPTGSDVTWDAATAIVRGDNWDDKSGSNTGCVSTFNWETFNDDMNGATVDMAISYNGGSFFMTSSITKGSKHYNYSYTKAIDGTPSTIDVCLSVNAAYLDITTSKYYAPVASTTVNATLDHTAAVQGGSNAAASSLDAATHYFNLFGTTGWAAQAYIGFSYSIPDASYTITEATLSFYSNASRGSARTIQVNYSDGSTFDWENLALSNAFGTTLYNASDESTTVTQKTIDATNAVNTILGSETSANILFQLGNANAGGILYGKTATEYSAPSLSITYTNAATASYTVNFLNAADGTVIKSAATHDGIPVGSIMDATSEEKATFTDADHKYVYASSTVGIVDGEGTNEINVYFTVINKESITVKAVDDKGNELTTLYSENAFLDGSTVKMWSKYIKVGEDWYVTEAPYGKVITEATNEVVYVKSDVAYFFEYEGLTNSRKYGEITGDYANYSNGGGYGLYSAANSYSVAISEAGYYDLTLAVVARNGGKTDKHIVKAKSGDTYEGSYEFAHSSNTGTYTIKGIYIPAGYSLYLEDGTPGNSNAYYDYITLTPTKVSATIASSGYSTIASEYALDCANLPLGLKAYQVTGATTTAVNLAEVTEAVAAGTGLILEGTAGQTYSIPVAVSGSDLSATNKLQAAVTATEVAANTAYILQGGEFHLVTETSTVPAGKAYLLAGDDSAARSLDIVFGDADGITAIDNAQSTGNAMFDLSGRRVAKAQKGIYIVNGKKVVK